MKSANAPFDEFGQSMILRDIEDLYIDVDRINKSLFGLTTGATSLAQQVAKNLSSINSINVTIGGLGSTYLARANNLSDVASAATSRTNLGLGTAATQAATFFLQVANNLSDLNNAGTARTNLGLSAAAVMPLPVSIGNGGTGQSTAILALAALAGVPVAYRTYSRIYTANATHTYQTGSRFALIILVGAGGGGAGSYATGGLQVPGDGGGSGEIVYGVIPVTGGGTTSFTIGSGGTGGSTGGGFGFAGGVTSGGLDMSAAGGLGGQTPINGLASQVAAPQARMPSVSSSGAAGGIGLTVKIPSHAGGVGCSGYYVSSVNYSYRPGYGASGIIVSVSGSDTVFGAGGQGSGVTASVGTTGLDGCAIVFEY